MESVTIGNIHSTLISLFTLYILAAAMHAHTNRKCKSVMMSRILSETLIKYQSEEEAKVMKIADELDNIGKELVPKLYAPLKITSEDLSREYNPSDIKQLCLRTKVRVDMTLFNCVWDAKQRLERKGRLKERSERFVNKMLVKAVSRRMVIPYTDEEIARCNHVRQCQLKKCNNFRLDRWRHVSSQASVLEHSSPNQTPLPGQSSTQSSDIPLIYLVSTNSQSSASSINVLTSQPEINEIPVNGEITNKSKRVETIRDISIGSTTAKEWGEAAAQVNTESLNFDTLDLDLQTQQTESQPVVLGSEGYGLFDTQVPCTSTQTQRSQLFL